MFMRWRTNTLTSSQLSSLTRTKVFAAWKMCEGTRTIHIISEKNERCVASNILITALLHAKRKIQLSLIFKCHFIWLWYISIRIYFDIWWFINRWIFNSIIYIFQMGLNFQIYPSASREGNFFLRKHHWKKDNILPARMGMLWTKWNLVGHQILLQRSTTFSSVFSRRNVRCNF